MSHIIAYLTFRGCCRQAMTFYQQCLGGELYLQTVGESPMAERLPKRMQDCIVHACLTHQDMRLMATDMVGEAGLWRGNSVSLMLDCRSEEEIKACYQKLSKEGQATHPIAPTFWGALFGGLTDKYGNHWLLNYQG